MPDKKLPWEWSEHTDDYGITTRFLRSADDEAHVILGGCGLITGSEDDRAYLALACNSHAALVEAARKAKRQLDAFRQMGVAFDPQKDDAIIDEVAAALALARRSEGEGVAMTEDHPFENAGSKGIARLVERTEEALGPDDCPCPKCKLRRSPLGQEIVGQALGTRPQKPIFIPNRPKES